MASGRKTTCSSSEGGPTQPFECSFAASYYYIALLRRDLSTSCQLVYQENLKVDLRTGVIESQRKSVSGDVCLDVADFPCWQEVDRIQVYKSNPAPPFEAVFPIVEVHSK